MEDQKESQRIGHRLQDICNTNDQERIKLWISKKKYWDIQPNEIGHVYAYRQLTQENRRVKTREKMLNLTDT